MKLYSLALSPYAARVRCAIYAKGLTVDVVAPPSDWRTSPAFRSLSPLARIPVLVLDDGTAIAESGVIVEYLDDAAPEPPLRPRSPEARARVRFVTQLAEVYVMSAMMPLFFLFDAKERDAAAIDAQLAKLDDALGKLDAALEPGSYAHGGELSTADAFLAPMRFTLDGLMSFSGRTTLLDPHARVAAYADVAQRDPALGRVWREMADGLIAYMNERKAAAA